MKPLHILGLLALAAAVGSGGYWLGAQRGAAGDHGAAAPSADAARPADAAGRKILYYRNPMGLPDTSPVPKKDSMGMDYIPVYEGDDTADTAVRLSEAKIQRSGVRVAPIERRVLDAAVRAMARVEINERRLVTIAPKFEGYIERLLVNATGQTVQAGQPLFEAYSPELVLAQREYAIARAALDRVAQADEATVTGLRRLGEAALARLRAWDVGDAEIERIVRAAAGGDDPVRTLTIRAPAGGTVIERKATQGMRFMAGEMLYQIADLSTVWLIADVYEQDLARVRAGQAATASFAAYPGETFRGRVAAVYPTVRTETRTVPVRIELPNPVGRLKPAMYGQVQIDGGGPAVLAAPAAAVIDSGRRQVILVARGDGRFEPREVRLGARGDDWVAVLDGVKEGESVVVAGNFLLDSEANLRAALGALAGGGAAAKATHTATGRIEEIDAKSGTLLIAHDPVASLNWPKMTMEFVPANDAIRAQARPGLPIRFDFVERKPGEWVVTKIAPAGASGAGK